MRIKRLIKELEVTLKKYGNRDVVCNTQAMVGSCNGVYNIVHVTKVEAEFVQQCDGDGFPIDNKDGTSRERLQVILS